MSVQVAKIVVHLVERRAELNTAIYPPHRQAIAAAVLSRQIWRLDDPLEPLYELGAELGTSLTEHARCALGVQRGAIQVYGKAALVGTAVPLECAAALYIHEWARRYVPVYRGLHRSFRRSQSEAPRVRAWTSRCMARLTCGTSITSILHR